MRGTPGVGPAWVECVGIIPAYAGNTNAMSWVTPWREDHPRICGEHRDLAAVAFAWLGSSPHMRGTRVEGNRQASRIGIIPAYAGNTVERGDCMVSSEDHPRICGEHHCTYPPYGGNEGSSPHMRGTRVVEDYH